MNNNIKVKICATRSLEAAEVAIDSGAEFLGLVFTPNTKTHTIDLNVAKKIGKILKGKINLVGVFQNMPLAQAQNIIRDCNLDYGQFHGDETQRYINKIKVKKIKAFRFGRNFDLDVARKHMQQFNVDYYLIDRIQQSEGAMIDLEKAAVLAKEFPLIFAGGLTPENVTHVIEMVQPLVVDVASGIETDGKQDLGKIRRFIRNAKKNF